MKPGNTAPHYFKHYSERFLLMSNFHYIYILVDEATRHRTTSNVILKDFC
ncbi:MAG: hypothetical protein IKA22_01390 [Lentisphaeria bacterium]|nr:hypothetical protein [Lentisphaeria bacterium]